MKKKEEMRGEKKQHAPLRAFLFFLIALLVYEIGRTVGTLAVGLLSGPLLVGMGGKGAEGLQDGLMLLAAPLGGAVACIGVFGRKLCFGHWRQEQIAPKDGTERKPLQIRMAFLVFAAASALGLNLLLALLHITQQSSAFEEVAAVQAAVPVWMGLCIYGICAPFSEELSFRGLIYGKARSLFPPAAAMVFSGLLFGLSHGNLVQAIYGCILGTILSFIYEREGRLLEPVLFHGVANLAVYLLIDVWGLGMRLSVAGAWFLCVLLLLMAVSAGWMCYGRGRK